ncbi:MAG TPA: hypothetical protein VI584_07105, partial [Nitrospiria bacterium]|nr:hypothetical protein [Nitrospiria bacterium]
MPFNIAYNPAQAVEKTGSLAFWAGRGMKSFKEKILVVDDDPDIRQILCDRIQALGYQVATADN